MKSTRLQDVPFLILGFRSVLMCTLFESVIHPLATLMQTQQRSLVQNNEEEKKNVMDINVAKAADIIIYTVYSDGTFSKHPTM